MEIRKVQKTGDMHYVYLPTNWCKKHKITSSSKLSIDENSYGALILNPRETLKELSSVEITIEEEDLEIINKLIMGCYINPVSSFKINLTKGMDTHKLLRQKNIISLESVEIDEDAITADSNVVVSDPDQLLKTMVKKVKNLAIMMSDQYNRELVGRYEEEIDRIKTMIEKATINYMTFSSPSKIKMIDIYYISLISRDLERMVDHLIKLDSKEEQYIKHVTGVIRALKEIVEGLDFKSKKRFNYKTAINFLKEISKLKANKQEYDKMRIRTLLINISEVITDWSITNEIEAKKQ